MSEIKVIPVTAAAFLLKWKEVEPLLARAMPVSLRRYEAIDILMLVVQQPAAFQGWFAVEGDDNILAVMVTQICQYPRRRCLGVFCLAGERMSEWIEQGYKLMIEYAQERGVDHFEVQGRKGWEKVLGEKLGELKARGTVLVADIAPLEIGGAE